MNTKQTLAALGLLIGGIVLFGFLSSRSTTAPAPAAEATTVPAGEFVEEGQYASISIAYPEAPTAVRAAIEAEMQGVVATFKQNTNIENLTPEDIQTIGLGESRKYALVGEYGVRTSPEYDSYAYIMYEDTLGAHPNTYFKTFVFDKQGNRVQLAQLFPQNPNWLEELSLLVSTDVTAQYRTRTNTEDITGQLYPEGLAAKEDNFKSFVVDGDNLIILIPPYQVAAYAVGPFEVVIPLADLR